MRDLIPWISGFLFLVLPGSLALTGCDKTYPGGEKLYPVTITVSESGQPVDNAVVILVRENGQGLNTAGLTDGSGKAVIMVDAEWKGAPLGTYSVRISKEPPFTPDLSDEEYAALRPDLQEEYNNKMQAKRSQLKPVVPLVLSGDKSPLKLEVTAGKNEETYDIAEHW